MSISHSSSELTATDFSSIFRDSSTELAHRPLGSRRGSPPYRVKRILDICYAALGLCLLSPLLMLIALAIRLESPGPVLFRQLRLGRGGRAFCLYKFRTMIRDAEACLAGLEHLNESPDRVLFKMRRDPRITRVGRFLRRTSLD